MREPAGPPAGGPDHRPSAGAVLGGLAPAAGTRAGRGARSAPTAALIAASRFLTAVLRHHPGAAGITLDPGGWVEIATLLDALAAHGRALNRADLDAIVAGTDKRRFEVSGTRIRAAQGHSVPVDLGLDPVAPPPVLFHGTVARFLPGIWSLGLLAGRRRHVHLSPDTATAATVGARRGRPVVLTVDAAAMHAAGHAFYRAANGVWLTDHVPPDFLRAPESTQDTGPPGPPAHRPTGPPGHRATGPPVR